MKTLVFKVIVLICVILSVIGLSLYYWYEYRPSDIRAICEEEKKMNSRPHPPWEQTKRRVRTYQQCLEENGIEK